MALRTVTKMFPALQRLQNSSQFSVPLAARFAHKTVNGLKYLESHDWAEIKGNTATVGITDFAQAELGEIVYVELPEVGSEFKQNDTYGVVESVKAASDVHCPISGKVIEVNQRLVENPSLVNTDSFGEGWIAKLEVVSNAEDLKQLLDKDAYEKICESA